MSVTFFSYNERLSGDSVKTCFCTFHSRRRVALTAPKGRNLFLIRVTTQTTYFKIITTPTFCKA
jgi:hypothetical protein